MTIGFALTGSFCTFAQVLPQLERLAEQYGRVVPIFSQVAATTDSRFGLAKDFVALAETICGCSALTTIAQVEPIGPKKLLDALVIAPCTGNTLGKLANGIADGPVTMAAKSHLRNGRPVIVAVSTNDALAGSAQNIGKLLARNHFYFVPFGQDDPLGKPTSMVANFAKLPETVALALEGHQYQPMIVGK